VPGSWSADTILKTAGPAQAQPPEDPAFLASQLITCIGNKRALLPLIGRALDIARRELGRERLDVLDAFAGSGVVSRYFKRFARRLISNDLEPYAHQIARCYLANASEIDLPRLRGAQAQILEQAREQPVREGIIRRLYAPRNEENIQPGERVFYTIENARRLDTFRTLIGELPRSDQPFLLAPLLSEASIHANTAGVFKGFYKDRATGIGCYGGSNGDALARIKGRIELNLPVLSRHECEWQARAQDANELAREIEPVDVAYFDPPYNQHPYGSNYFMLNLLCDYREPASVSKVSGIPAGWKRSAYNSRKRAASALEALIAETPARYVLLSYNDEGLIPPAQMQALLQRHGRLRVLEQSYNTFRGSRNLKNRSMHVKERLYLLRRG
jgi:adenine-specific DNA-methyltransferase